MGKPEVAFPGRLAFVEKTCLATVAVVIVANCMEWFLPQGHSIWRPMSWEAALVVLLTAVSLYLCRDTLHKPAHYVSGAFALLVTLGASGALATQALLRRPGMDIRLMSSHRTMVQVLGGISPESAAAFALLGATVVLVRTRRQGPRIVVDFLTLCSALAVLFLCSGYIFALLDVFGPSARPGVSSGTIICLLMLATAMFIRRAQCGSFPMLFDGGIGSKLARRLAPVLLVLPYFREIMRSRIIDWHRMPPNNATAFIASCTAVVTIVLMFYIGWRLNLQESEIQSLSLCDDLTGLYNLRGFRLLAEQALLLARRSGQPFSIIFLDLDNLKQTNDTLGHQAGSAFLIEMAEILRESFRETDVLARIGGDEFAVAGQLGAAAIAEASKRVRQAATQRNMDAGRPVGLSFSLGCITSEPGMHEPLADLLARADEEMYREKRRRKSLMQARAAADVEARPGIPPEYLSTGLRWLRETEKPKEIA